MAEIEKKVFPYATKLNALKNIDYKKLKEDFLDSEVTVERFNEIGGFSLIEEGFLICFDLLNVRFKPLGGFKESIKGNIVYESLINTMSYGYHKQFAGEVRLCYIPDEKRCGLTLDYSDDLTGFESSVESIYWFACQYVKEGFYTDNLSVRCFLGYAFQIFARLRLDFESYVNPLIDSGACESLPTGFFFGNSDLMSLSQMTISTLQSDALLSSLGGENCIDELAYDRSLISDGYAEHQLFQESKIGYSVGYSLTKLQSLFWLSQKVEFEPTKFESISWIDRREDTFPIHIPSDIYSKESNRNILEKIMSAVHSPRREGDDDFKGKVIKHKNLKNPDLQYLLNLEHIYHKMKSPSEVYIPLSYLKVT